MPDPWFPFAFAFPFAFPFAFTLALGPSVGYASFRARFLVRWIAAWPLIAAACGTDSASQSAAPPGVPTTLQTTLAADASAADANGANGASGTSGTSESEEPDATRDTASAQADAGPPSGALAPSTDLAAGSAIPSLAGRCSRFRPHSRVHPRREASFAKAGSSWASGNLRSKPATCQMEERSRAIAWDSVDCVGPGRRETSCGSLPASPRPVRPASGDRSPKCSAFPPQSAVPSSRSM